MDLKALLVEAKQKVPPVLQVLQTGDETMLDIGGTNYILIAETSLYSLHAQHCCNICLIVQKYKIKAFLTSAFYF